MKFSKIDNKLVGSFEFRSFSEAIAFIVELAILADKENHHPLIINEYSRVEVSYTTHDSGNVLTERDYDLAKKTEQIAKRYILK